MDADENAEKLFILHWIIELEPEYIDSQVDFYSVEYVWRQTFQH